MYFLIIFGGTMMSILTTTTVTGGILDIADDILPITTSFYREKDGHRMVEVIEVNTYIGGKKLVDCFLYGDNYIIEKMLELVPKKLVKVVPKKDISKLVNQCNELLYKKIRENAFDIIKTPFDFARKIFKSFLIFPGTKWCGAGDVADDYDDLGPATETDMCCRTHDHCNDSIVGFETKYKLKNKDFYTKSHCDCDNGFHQCLLEGETLISDAVGHLFFNILQTQCFKNEYPIVKCLKKWGIPIVRDICQEYELDENKPKKYQFFDGKMYQGKHEPSFLKNLLSH
ncbi:phospholipase A2 hemilipin-like [Centruroides vittatus]|uniref:phospholipase A2 hemilipin-like n=1 Tax=Centruroides vittatus TaxID=120091 RepID=UPI00350ED616